MSSPIKKIAAPLQATVGPSGAVQARAEPRLITCSGSFDRSAGHRDSRLGPLAVQQCLDVAHERDNDRRIGRLHDLEPDPRHGHGARRGRHPPGPGAR